MTALGGGFGGAGVGAAAGDGGDDEFGVTEFRSIRSYCCAGGDDAIGGGVDFYQWWPWPVEKLTEMTVRWRGVFPVVDWSLEVPHHDGCNHDRTQLRPGGQLTTTCRDIHHGGLVFWLAVCSRSLKASFCPRLPRLVVEARGGGNAMRDAQADCAFGLMASGPTCIQRLDGSRDSAIHNKYRISLRSSSMREPRYPLLRVVLFLLKTLLPPAHPTIRVSASPSFVVSSLAHIVPGFVFSTEECARTQHSQREELAPSRFTFTRSGVVLLGRRPQIS
ncbi:hypothetical protein F0562_033889 [Nyssa sinensis]|uniref:Uncharacterized protein n=1 Tax=Nyssa sinensis TaxID=561372 RepID=A0A5J5AHG6_9ASTE|nr:hypothetical protein F0562_033889 [Nyssa sinensis]